MRLFLLSSVSESCRPVQIRPAFLCMVSLPKARCLYARCTVFVEACTSLMQSNHDTGGACLCRFTPGMYAPGLGFLMFAVGINLRPEAFKKVFMSPKVIARPGWAPFMLIPFTFAAP